MRSHISKRMLRANGGGDVRDGTKRERDSPMGGGGAAAGEDEALARKVNDLQSSTDKFNRNAGFITRLGARATAVRASSRAQASERAGQPMQLATGGAESDAAGGSAPMEGVEVLFRCSRAPHLPQQGLGSVRMLTANPNQVDGLHCCSRAPREQDRHLREHGAHDGGAAGTEPRGHHRADRLAAGA